MSQRKHTTIGIPLPRASVIADVPRDRNVMKLYNEKGMVVATVPTPGWSPVRRARLARLCDGPNTQAALIETLGTY